MITPFIVPLVRVIIVCAHLKLMVKKVRSCSNFVTLLNFYKFN